MLIRSLILAALLVIGLGSTARADRIDVCTDVISKTALPCPSEERACVGLMGVPAPQLCFPVP